jgi:hypothetical protein
LLGPIGATGTFLQGSTTGSGTAGATGTTTSWADQTQGSQLTTDLTNVGDLASVMKKSASLLGGTETQQVPGIGSAYGDLTDHGKQLKDLIKPPDPTQKH